MKESKVFFDDEDFQDHLVGLLCRDTKTLRSCASLLHANDFKPLRGMRWGRPRWIVADRALEHYQKHHEPLNRLVRSDVLQYATSIGMTERQINEIEEYLVHLRKLRLTEPDTITEKVVHYKRQRIKAATIQEMVELQAAGHLTDEKWHELSQQGAATSNELKATDYFADLENRLTRRRLQSRLFYIPRLFIDPLDNMVRAIGPGQLGLGMAPTKRGKSLFLLWVALAYTVQHLNVLLFTLEDPQEEVENRLDSIVSGIPILNLAEYPQHLRGGFGRFRRLLRSRLHVVDGTEGLSIPQMEQVFLRERDRGVPIDAIFIDYDDEIIPTVRHKEKRFESADIYRELRRMAARYSLIIWTAAQTQRGTEGMKILSGDRVAEDISKIRKVSMALSLGQGDWSPESIYLWVAGHKFDRGHVGCHIMPDKTRMMIYDRDRTRKAMLEHQQEEGE